MAVKTGIPGLDEVLHGGIPEGSIVLVSGGAGSGKTIFCSQFLNYGLEKEEPGVYISMEESEKQLINNMKSFGWDLGRSGIELSKLTLYNFDTLKENVQSMVENNRAKRLVIDPMTHFGLFFERNIELRRSLVDLIAIIKKLGVTTILTSEIQEGSSGISMYGMEEFVCDGVIVMRKRDKKGTRIGAIEVLKMRGTDHERDLYPYEITKKGIIVHPDQSVL